MSKLAHLTPPMPEDQVFRINYFNVPMLGSRGSLEVPDAMKAVVSDLINFPHLSLTFILLPNVPQYGHLNAAGDDWDENVDKNQDWLTQLLVQECQANTAIKLVRGSGRFTLASMWSPTRSLTIKWLVLMSRKAAGERGPSFQRSFLVKRKELINAAACMQRNDFADWTAETDIYNKDLNEDKARMQHFSGAPLALEVIRSICSGCRFTQEHRLMIRDFTPLDDCLGQAVSTANAEAQKEMPQLGYLAVSFNHALEATRMIVTDKIQESIRQHILKDIRSGAIRLQSRDLATAGAPPLVEMSQRPTFREESYQITFPTASGDLQIRQEQYTLWSSQDATKTEWAECVRAHDAEFNLSQVPWKGNKRAAEETVASAQGPSNDAVELPVDASTRADLEAAGCKVQESPASFYSFLVSPTGNLWIHATADGILDLKEAMFFIRGNFFHGQVATNIMSKPDDAWVKLALSSESLVSVSFKKPVDPPAGHTAIDAAPYPLGRLLGWLEAAGMVRVAMHKHGYSRDNTQPHNYKVEAADVLCLQAKVKEGSGALSLNMLSAWMSVPLLKECPHLQITFCVNYDQELNKLSVGVPGVFPTKPIRVRSDSVYKLF